jgi:hypothetical protein
MSGPAPGPNPPAGQTPATPPSSAGGGEPPPPPRPPAPPREDFSFLPFPLQDGERVLALRRKHWIFLWPKIAVYILIGIIPVLIVRWLFDQIGLLDDVDSVLWIIVALWLLFWALRAVLTWYRFQNDIWTITNQRLIDSRRKHPFDLTVSTADLVNVQDMLVARNGILATILDFGDIICQTASADASDFKLAGIPNPRETQILVDRERDRERLRVRGV